MGAELKKNLVKAERKRRISKRSVKVSVHSIKIHSLPKSSDTTLMDLLTSRHSAGINFEPIDVTKQVHYTQHRIQPIEYIQLNNLGWCAGNIIKYVSRENLKNGLQDLEKARVYLDCLIHYKKTGEFLTPDKIPTINSKA